MVVLESRIDRSTTEYAENRDYFEQLLAEMQASPP